MGEEKKDWRVGLSVRPKYRTHPLYYEPPGEVVAVEPSGTGGVTDPGGVLRIRTRNGTVHLAAADDWVTA